MGEFAVPAVSQSTPPQLTGHRVWWNRFSGFEGAYQSSYSSVKTGTLLQQWNPQPTTRGIAEEIRYHQINISHRHCFVVRPWTLLSKKQVGWIQNFLNSVMKTADLHVSLARCFVTHLRDSVVNPDLSNLELSIPKCCTNTSSATSKISYYEKFIICFIPFPAPVPFRIWVWKAIPMESPPPEIRCLCKQVFSKRPTFSE